MTEEEEQQLDIEAIQDKTEELKKLDDLTFDPDQFEELEREYKNFMEEIIGNGNLTKFKDEYQKVWKMLKSSYE